jgi:hypothetical protein
MESNRLRKDRSIPESSSRANLGVDVSSVGPGKLHWRVVSLRSVGRWTVWRELVGAATASVLDQGYGDLAARRICSQFPKRLWVRHDPMNTDS